MTVNIKMPIITTSRRDTKTSKLAKVSPNFGAFAIAKSKEI